MADFTHKSYGRNDEVAAIFQLLMAGRDVSMHGPRRLGKSFVLDRLVEQAGAHDFVCLKIDVSGCDEPKKMFRQLCQAIGQHASPQRKALTWLQQRLTQLVSPGSDANGPWYQPMLSLEWASYLERLLGVLQADAEHHWAILIDELPIFLKALHDRGEAGVLEARNFMNGFSRLRAAYPRVRWLVTGSIGIEPLAKAGQYMGVMVKFHPFGLQPLSDAQARDFLLDLARGGLLGTRRDLSTAEVVGIMTAIGWNSPHYLEELARQLPLNMETDLAKAQANIAAAQAQMLRSESAFGVYEEHIRKHHAPEQRRLSLAILGQLCQHEAGLALDGLLAALGQANLERIALRKHLQQLMDEGFLHVTSDDETARWRFHMPLLRLWWARFQPAV